jgi:hypothetical protein
LRTLAGVSKWLFRWVDTALSRSVGSLSCHYAAITRQGGRENDFSGLPNRFATNALFGDRG